MILNLLEQTTPSELGVKWLVSSWYSDSLFSVLIGWLSKVLSRFGMFFAEKRAQLVLIVCNCWRDEKSQTLTKCFGGLTLENKTAKRKFLGESCLYRLSRFDWKSIVYFQVFVQDSLASYRRFINNLRKDFRTFWQKCLKSMLRCWWPLLPRRLLVDSSSQLCSVLTYC